MRFEIRDNECGGNNALAVSNLSGCFFKISRLISHISYLN